MSTTEFQPVESEAQRVERWRADELQKAGYDATSALELAARLDIDLHRAIALIESGCPPAIAVRILL